MPIIGETEPVMGRETRIIAALLHMFSEDRHENSTINSRAPDITGRCLTNSFASDLSVDIAWKDLERIEPEQAKILTYLYKDHHSRRHIEERFGIDRDYVALQESRGITQLIRWVWDEPEYEPMLRTYKRAKKKDTPEWKDWQRFRQSDAYILWMRARKRRMGV